MTSESQTSPLRRRRRSVSQSKTVVASDGFLGFLRSGRFGKFLLAAMLGLAAFRIWSVWREVNAGIAGLGPVTIGMSREELRYRVGEPQSQAGPAAWHYVEAGRTITVTFSAATDRVTAISCGEQGSSPAACPDLLGVRVGEGDADVVRALGPGRESFAAGKAWRRYPQIGASIELSGGKVSTVTLDPAPGQIDPWPIILWRLVP